MRFGEVELAIIDIITFIGIIITFLTGVLNLFQNKKSLYINNITKFRVIWITTLRGHIANLKELSNITNLYIITKDGTNKIAFRRELDKTVALIKMYLNFTSKLDSELIAKMIELKSTINSYLLIYYCRNTIKAVENNDELVIKFNEVVDVINEKKVLEALLGIAESNMKEVKIDNMDLLDVRSKVKSAYMNNVDLIRNIINESDYVIYEWENTIESLGNDIDDIVQIYLKAEWIKCKIETRMWPFSRYNEDKVIEKLKKDYKKII